MKIIKLFCLTVSVVFCVCCTNQTMYHSYQHIHQHDWDRNDTLFFTLSITDTLKHYSLSIIVRNNNSYPYQELPLSVTYNLPDSTMWETDSLIFSITDEKGKWLGSGWGGLFQSSLILKETAIPHPGNYQFKIVPLINGKLSGICDVGVQAKGITISSPGRHLSGGK